MNFEEAKAILGLNGTLTPQLIHQAFRRMALRYHPDRYRTFAERAWATRHFIKIKEARDLLMNAIHAGGISTDTFQEKDPFYGNGDTSKPKYNKYYSELRSLPIIRWFFFLLERCEGLVHPLDQILIIIITISFIAFLPALLAYLAPILILTAILREYGIQAHANSPMKRDRFVCLLIITLPSIPFGLLYMPWGLDDPYFRSKVYCFGPIFLIVVIEWISFFLTEIWRHPIENDLQSFSRAIVRE